MAEWLKAASRETSDDSLNFVVAFEFCGKLVQGLHLWDITALDAFVATPNV